MNILVLSIFGVMFIQPSIGVFISNLNDSCLRCLCHVAGCETARGCAGGYCGPYYISRVYWTDAGKPTFPEDDSSRDQAYEDCARDYQCSRHIVTEYLARFGRDCNGDGVTDCFDYMMINFNGGQHCRLPLFLSQVGRRHLARYQQCTLADT